MKTDLYELPRQELTELVLGWGEPAFRAQQIWHWLYRQLATSLTEMHNLPPALRERMERQVVVGQPKLVAARKSADGEAEKWLLEMADGETVETVLMSYDRGDTLCISSQVGCAMGCLFCATGQMGFRRHLSSGEIVAQAVASERELRRKGRRLKNLVFMGMGEPLHNYAATVEAIRCLIDPDGFGLGARRVTVSTVGLAPQIRRLADEEWQVGLAISLHAATDEERSRLIPAARGWSVVELVAAGRHYWERTGRRVTFECALIQGENDTLKQAEALSRLVSDMPCHVNLIPLNATAGYVGQGSSPKRVNRFCQVLTRHGVSCTVRLRRGTDIEAGCGQLRQQLGTAASATQTA